MRHWVFAPNAGATKTRSLSNVLLSLTFAISLVLGLVAAAATMWVDLEREKEAVESVAMDFVASATPSAAAAAFNFDQASAEQVATGLFLDAAIVAVEIVNEGVPMLRQEREVEPTLPQLGVIGSEEIVQVTRQLYEPGDNGDGTPIGELSVKIDKSLVAPEIVGRLTTYFVVTTAKNVLFGLLLFWLVFNVLAKHISQLSEVAQSWKPGSAALCVPSARNFMRGTEVESLGKCIEKLTVLASGALDTAQQSHDAVVRNVEVLSEEVQDRTRELEEANLRLRRMADFDGLTSLYNRGSFDRHLSQSFGTLSDNTGSLSLLLIDVDQFKAYNDFYGHQAGDRALVCLAGVLKSVQQETGCFVARYGGEEFAGILNSKTITPEHVADLIHKELRSANIKHQQSTVARQMTVSIGIARTEEGNTYASADMLVSAADDALYEAKNSGRNQTKVSTVEIRKRAKDQRLSVQALLDSIEAREFVPFGQPQVDERTGELVGVECLVRWARPDGSVFPPGKFMPNAEKAGIVSNIDAIMVEKLGKFLEVHPNVLPRMSLNVTGGSITSDSYVQDIVNLARCSNTGIAVELLETAFIDRPDTHLIWLLDQLRDAGVQIELDDFGTGRTSILGLMAIGPNRLKIARELICPLDSRDEQKRIVASVLEIAASLKMDVIAEGVETRETARVLTELGCPIQQGFYYGKPMPLDDLIANLERENSVVRWPVEAAIKELHA